MTCACHPLNTHSVLGALGRRLRGRETHRWTGRLVGFLALFCGLYVANGHRHPMWQGLVILVGLDLAVWLVGSVLFELIPATRSRR